MGKSDRKPIIGLLGGMCSGKSTAAEELGRMGCAVIDADEIAHQLLDDEDIRAKIVQIFGEEVLDTEGRVSRAGLAKTAFSDADELALLTEILHPPVLVKVEELIGRYESQPEVKAIVLDMPLLLEVGWEKRCDYVIFIDCDASKRLERAQKTGVFDADELKIRENLQISLDKKKRIADNIVNNNSDLSSLSKQIASIFSTIMDKG
ncbi:MAG: dephospho-CoA kinase [Planctomycetota bacterium]